jgi:predicted GH43/DUF377 family glycosyl hydrolase
MKTTVTRTQVRINPDYKKVIPRFFNTGHERSLLLISQVLKMEDGEAAAVLDTIFTEFSNRYRNIHDIVLKHFNLVKDILTEDEQKTLSEEKKLLIGSYFTMEYSIEAAALFNPSIVEDPDQSGVAAGHKKVILSFRATGESHISSLVFKRGLLDEHGMINVEQSGKFIGEGMVTKQTGDHTNILYEVDFPEDSLMSERVIFPIAITEKNGIEDARFVKFTEDDSSVSYIATYTAYDGSFIRPHLIMTTDFCHFKVAPLHGKSAINKNLALFPRKVNGKYAMISRIDGINNYIMFSHDLFLWEEAILLQKPKFPWELVQIGNAGSPIETEKGWLVITHGVGPMRKYCLGASLFDLHDPTIELGRLKEPLLVPNEEERHGYVPNVVYSCGSIVHADKLFIPYAVSDHASSFASVPVKDLLEDILSSDD